MPEVQLLGDLGTPYNLRVRQGETRTLLAMVSQKVPGQQTRPANLTGCTLFGGVRKRPIDKVFAVFFQFSMSPADALKGQFTFELRAADTWTLIEDRTRAPAVLPWRVSLKDSLGKVRPIYYGDLTVLLGEEEPSSGG